MLTNLKITDIKVAHTQKFYKYICDLAIKTNDLRLYLESFKLLEMVSGEEFIGDTFVEGILDKFDLCKTMDYEELKSFVDDYSESYLYLNLLNEAASDYFARRKFEQGFYFVEKALNIINDNEKARLNLLLYKTKCSGVSDLINLDTPLYEIKEFEELCEINDEVYYPLIEKQKEEKQRQIEDKIRQEEQAKLDAKRKVEEFWKGVGDFFGGIGKFFCNCGSGIGGCISGCGEKTGDCFGNCCEKTCECFKNKDDCCLCGLLFCGDEYTPCCLRIYMVFMSITLILIIGGLGILFIAAIIWSIIACFI